MKKWHSAVTVLFTVLAFHSPATGTTLFWDPDGDGTGGIGSGPSWTGGTNRWTSSPTLTPGSGANWNSGTPDAAVFDKSPSGLSGDVTVTLGSGVVTAASIGVGTVSNTSAETVTVQNNASGAGLTVNGGVSLSGNLTLNNNNSGPVNATWSFGGGVTGTGTLKLSNTSGDASSRNILSLTGTSPVSGGSLFIDPGSSGLTGVQLNAASATISRNVTIANNRTGYLGANGSTSVLSVTSAVSGTGSVLQVGSSVLGDAGKVSLNAGAHITTASININAGTLAINGTDVIGDTTNITMSGGRLAFSAAGLSESVGALTLTANSIIDFGDFGTSAGDTLKFLTVSNLGAFTLQIWNYTPGFDHLFFGNNVDGSGLLVNGVAIGTLPTPFGYGPEPGTLSIKFFKDDGKTPFFGATNEGGAFLPVPLDVNGPGEIVPVPEPTAVLSVALLLLAMGWKERRHFMRVRGSRAQGPGALANLDLCPVG